MSAPEFVALSEERLDEIRIAHVSAIFGGHPKRRRGALTNALLQVAREAEENTKRWLMEKVCGLCGKADCAAAAHWRCLNREDADGTKYLKFQETRAEYLSRTEPR